MDTSSETITGAAVEPSAMLQTKQPARKARPKPTHYKVMCISMYTRDIEALDAKVQELKRRGMTKMNKSELIRFALNRLDLSEVA
jgi:hypothetical protein